MKINHNVATSVTNIYWFFGDTESLKPETSMYYTSKYFQDTAKKHSSSSYTIRVINKIAFRKSLKLVSLLKRKTWLISISNCNFCSNVHKTDSIKIPRIKWEICYMFVILYAIWINKCIYTNFIMLMKLIIHF